MTFWVRNWFLVGLLLAIGTGYVFGGVFQMLDQSTWLPQVIVATVMFAMALPLESEQVLRVLRRPTGPLVATVIALGVAPLAAWPIAQLLGSELGPGLIVAAATPSTLASASVLTRRAGGNEAVSMMATLLTNGICFLVTPLWVRWLCAGAGVTFPIAPIIVQLIVIVLIPMVLAQVSRRWLHFAAWSTTRKVELGVYAQCGVLTMVMFGIAAVRERLAGSAAVDLTVGSFVAAAGAVVALHAGLLWVGWRVSKGLGLPRPDQIAVGFSGSQKTLMVGLTTALQIGLSVIPLIMYHILQLLIDTVVANRLRMREPGIEKTIVDPGMD